MTRWKLALAVLMATTACAADQGCCEAATVFPIAYVGEWRSVTPTLEFVGLTVRSKSGEQGVLGVSANLFRRVLGG